MKNCKECRFENASPKDYIKCPYWTNEETCLNFAPNYETLEKERDEYKQVVYAEAANCSSQKGSHCSMRQRCNIAKYCELGNCKIDKHEDEARERDGRLCPEQDTCHMLKDQSLTATLFCDDVCTCWRPVHCMTGTKMQCIYDLKKEEEESRMAW